MSGQVKSLFNRFLRKKLDDNKDFEYKANLLGRLTQRESATFTR